MRENLVFWGGGGRLCLFFLFFSFLLFPSSLSLSVYMSLEDIDRGIISSNGNGVVGDGTRYHRRR